MRSLFAIANRERPLAAAVRLAQSFSGESSRTTSAQERPPPMRCDRLQSGQQPGALGVEQAKGERVGYKQRTPVGL